MTVLCACQTLLDESHPTAITRHAESPEHRAWLDARYGEEHAIDQLIRETDAILREAGRDDLTITEREDTMQKTTNQLLNIIADDMVRANAGEVTKAQALKMLRASRYSDAQLRQTVDEIAARANPIDELPDDDPRHDPRLEDVAFIGTDEGQALLAAAQAATVEERKATKRANEKARRERSASVKAAEELSATSTVETRTHGRRQAPIGKVDARTATINAAAEIRAAVDAKSTIPPNNPLTLDFKHPMDVKGVQQYPILNRDGQPSKSQSDNYDWHCPTCGRRLRDAVCKGGVVGASVVDGYHELHEPVKAPVNYRRSDRVVA